MYRYIEIFICIYLYISNKHYKLIMESSVCMGLEPKEPVRSDARRRRRRRGRWDSVWGSLRVTPGGLH